MLTQILDQWEVLVELQRQQATWQQRWDRAQAEFQSALQQLDPHDADRLARVLAESLPTTLQWTALPHNPLGTHSSHEKSATETFPPTADPHTPTPKQLAPARGNDTTRDTTRETTTPIAAPEATRATATSPDAPDHSPCEKHHVSQAEIQTEPSHSKRSLQATRTTPAPQPKSAPAEGLVANPDAPATHNLSGTPQTPTATEQVVDEAAIFADETFLNVAPDLVTPAPAATPNSPGPVAAALPTHELPPAQQDLLHWATDTIGDGITENELFKAMRKSPFAGQARQLFELLRERDAFYESDDEVIFVHSLKKMAEYQNT